MSRFVKTSELPERTRVYQNHHFDSTRWEGFAHRSDDIVVASSYKAGTTWTQSIIAHLVFASANLPAPLSQLSPWLDNRISPLDEIVAVLEAQTHRRFIKTHLPIDGIPYDPKVKYVYVARDGRDVFMSLWNHYSNHTDDMYASLNDTPGRVGDPFPRPPDDLHELWAEWVKRGWFEWESDGWPYWSHLYNVQSWWEFRQLPNIALIHFADMIEDVEREVRRIADFLEFEVADDAWARIVKSVSFGEMKKKGEMYAPGGGSFWKGGAATFLNKGINGRWRGVLTPSELEQYDAACERSLTPDCRAWLEKGGSERL